MDWTGDVMSTSSELEKLTHTLATFHLRNCNNLSEFVTTLQKIKVVVFCLFHFPIRSVVSASFLYQLLSLLKLAATWPLKAPCR